jgi:excisionase family DNA binding protein
MPVDDKLISLKEASQVLGVKESTLRYWANQEKLRTVRTPGGHRRFSLNEVKQMAGQSSFISANDVQALEDQALGQIQQKLQSGELLQEEWFQRIPAEGRNRFKLLGRRLLVLLVRWALEIGGSTSIEEEARLMGHEYGSEMAGGGVRMVDTLTIFVVFRNAVLAALPADTWSKVMLVSDQITLGIAEGYERDEGRLSK